MFVFAFGVGTYVIFALTALYAIGFVESWVVAFTIDGTPGAETHLAAWVVNPILLGLFAGQHWLMAHPECRRLMARWVHPVLERSVQVLVSCLVLMFVFLRWMPMPFVLWDVGVNPLGFLLEMLSFGGWCLALVATFQLDHFELFGLKQVIYHARGEYLPPAEFQTPFPYSWVRHPAYLGVLVAVWCTPRMTVGHLLFAIGATAFVHYAAQLEERTLVYAHHEYRAYQAEVPMLNPFQRRHGARWSGR